MIGRHFRNFYKMASKLPYFTEGEVVKGFGRGSKELGIPTANFPNNVIEQLPEDMSCGVYYGWAKVGDGDVDKMVMSIGWNPYYHNKVKSMQVFNGVHTSAMVGNSILVSYGLESSQAVTAFKGVHTLAMETHIIQTFKEDFYGSVLKVAILGYIRNMKNFDSLDELIKEINHDIEEAKRKLDLPENLEFKTCNFFKS